MFNTNNRLDKQKDQTPDTSSSLPNSVSVTKLYLSYLSEHDDKKIPITSVEKESEIENRILLKFDQLDNLGHLHLICNGPKLNNYFSINDIFIISEILLKKSSTADEGVHDGDWDIIHILAEKESDYNYLFREAIKNNYIIIIAIRFEIFDANNLSRQLTLYPRSSNGTPLHRAVKEKDIKIIEALLKCNLDINVTNYVGWTPLYIAVILKMFDVVDLLISNGADLNVQDIWGQTPLFFVAAVKSLDAINILLKQSANFKLEDKFHSASHQEGYPLKLVTCNVNADILNSLDFLNHKKFCPQPECVFKETYLKIINALIKHGANINFQDSVGKTPLHYAVIMDNFECMQALLECNADVKIKDKYDNNVFHVACKFIRDECIQVLMNYNIDINAVDSGKRTALHLIINTKINVERKMKKNPNILFLLKHKADVNLKDASGKTVLHVASKNPDITMDIIELISNSSNDIHAKDGHERTAFHYAAQSHNLSALEYLLQKNADLNAKDCDGRTPLHATMKFDNKYTFFKCVKVLLDHKADINAVDNDLISPLHLACLIKNARAVEYLIEHEADSSMRDKDGKTVFHYACMPEFRDYSMKEHVKDILNVLVKENISVNCVDKFGKTPLHYVAENKDLLFMNELLLNIGADINIVDKDNNSALDELIKQRRHVRYDSSVILYKQHVVKMKVLELWVREKTLETIYKADDEENLQWIQSYESDCRNEIHSMKNTNLVSSRMSYFNFLKKNPCDTMNYTREEIIVDAIRSDELITKFSIYGHFVQCHLRELQRRSSLHEKIQKSLEPYIFEKLPTVRIDEILEYLDHSDLNLNVLFELMKPAAL